MGILGWTPDQFWQSVPLEVTAALDGWQEKNGNKQQPQNGQSMTLDRLKELARKYPDGNC